MTHTERDLSVLSHIIQYCDEIEAAIEAHSLTLEKIEADNIYKNGLSMSILQIGELVSVLSDEFKAEHDTMPWRVIKRMRDRAAHHYSQFDVKKLWETVTEDIAPLREYCQNYLAETEKSAPSMQFS
jgi:uncharacterized protein with HEPN domain